MIDQASAHGAPPAPRPLLPAGWTDPRPPVAAGMLAWLIALIVFLAVDGPAATTTAVCWAGLGVGLLGLTIFVIQRSAARRGTRGAQSGLG